MYLWLTIWMQLVWHKTTIYLRDFNHANVLWPKLCLIDFTCLAVVKENYFNFRLILRSQVWLFHEIQENIACSLTMLQFFFTLKAEHALIEA